MVFRRSLSMARETARAPDGLTTPSTGHTPSGVFVCVQCFAVSLNRDFYSGNYSGRGEPRVGVELQACVRCRPLAPIHYCHRKFCLASLNAFPEQKRCPHSCFLLSLKACNVSPLFSTFRPPQLRTLQSGALRLNHESEKKQTDVFFFSSRVKGLSNDYPSY